MPALALAIDTDDGGATDQLMAESRSDWTGVNVQLVAESTLRWAGICSPWDDKKSINQPLYFVVITTEFTICAIVEIVKFYMQGESKKCVEWKISIKQRYLHLKNRLHQEG